MQTRTGTEQRRLDTLTLVHEHGWRVDSRHATSLGDVVYVRCAQCGTLRVDLQDRPDHPPTALCRELRWAGDLVV
jgi:hypothetical protein